MKAKVLLMALTLTSLWSCQQDEVLEDQSNQQVINFTSVVAGDNAMTRAGNAIDIVSMCTDKEQAFSVFNIKKDFRLWSELGVDNVNFYAHYPKLQENDSYKESRVLQGGVDYMFGTAKALFGQHSVCLEFKRVTAPIYVDVVGENGTALKVKSIKLKIKNKGYQNLHTGAITIPANVEKEEVMAKSMSDNQIFMNVLPQKMDSNTQIEVELENGKTYRAALSQDVQLYSGESYKMTIQGDRVVVSIFDGCIPL